jgi:hypothetical protein
MSATEVRDPFEVRDVDAERALAPLADAGTASAFDTWFGRALLAVALMAVLICDLRLVGDTPNYLPDNEANRVAVLQYVAGHGTPPVLGKDFYIVEPTGPVPPHTTVLRRMIPGQSPSVLVNTRYPQAFALQRPYPYYLTAPVSWIVPWNHRILALRLLCVLLACAGIVFLWKAVREAWPANPVAAGVAAVVLGTMSGLVEGFSVFQPEALLFALWCAGMWLVLRDLRLRRCSPWTVAVWTAATCVSGVAVLAALAAVAVLSLRSDPAGARGRRLAGRLAVVVAPSVAWVLWNLHAYGDPWPLDTALTGPDRPRNWHGLTAGLGTIFNVSVSIFDQLYSSGVAPLRDLDQRPEAIVAVVFVLAVASALWFGQIALARLPLARLGALMLGSFVCIYLTLFLSSVLAAAPQEYGEAKYGGYAAAWAGVVGIGFTAPLVGRRRLTVAAVGLLTLVLVGVMLRAPTL